MSLARQSPDGGGGRTRTYEGIRQRIYSPPPLPLGTLPLYRACLDTGDKKNLEIIAPRRNFSAREVMAARPVRVNDIGVEPLPYLTTNCRQPASRL